MAKEIAVIEKQLNPIVEQAKSLRILGPKEMEIAAEMRGQIKKISKLMTDEKEKVTAPLNEALKAERARWKPREEALDEALRSLNRKMTDYQTEEDRKAQEAAEKIAARVGEGKGKLKSETAMAKIDELEKPATSIATTTGGVRFRVTKQFRIIDEKKIPRDYLVIDDVKVRAAMKEGKAIAGIEYYEEKTPVSM